MLETSNMHFIERTITPQIIRAAKSFPAVVITGPRRSGKTFVLKHQFPSASYHLFEDPDVIARFRNDPQGFLDGVKLPAILDEIQNTPEVFNYVRSRIDREPRRTGRWFLTGSQETGLMQNVTESMAGRAAVMQLLPLSAAETPRMTLLHGGYPEVLARPRAARLWFSSYLQTYLERDVRAMSAAVMQLLPLSAAETPRMTLLHGGYPEVLARPRAARLWFSSYLQTYLERDVRAMSAVQELSSFRRFLALVATRHGQILNKSDLAGPLGMSVPSVARWLDILEATGQVLVVPPYFENFGKRLIKSPKVYIADSGLACHLLGIETDAELEKSPFLGAIFEGFIASEIVKSQLNAGRRREIYYFRDQQGLEVDFIVPGRDASATFVEVKSSRTVTPSMAVPMQRLAEAWRKRPGDARSVRSIVVHRPPKSGTKSKAIAADVEAISWRELGARGGFP